jgi:hypothetical protein
MSPVRVRPAVYTAVAQLARAPRKEYTVLDFLCFLYDFQAQKKKVFASFFYLCLV